MGAEARPEARLRDGGIDADAQIRPQPVGSLDGPTQADFFLDRRHEDGVRIQMPA